MRFCFQAPSAIAVDVVRDFDSKLDFCYLFELFLDCDELIMTQAAFQLLILKH